MYNLTSQVQSMTDLVSPIGIEAHLLDTKSVEMWKDRSNQLIDNPFIPVAVLIQLMCLKFLQAEACKNWS